MVITTPMNCTYEDGLMQPSCGVAGSTKAEVCSNHARAGMVNVKHKTCSDESCSPQPPYGVAGSNNTDCSSKHTRAGIVDVVCKRCRKKGRSESSLDKEDNFDEETLCAFVKENYKLSAESFNTELMSRIDNFKQEQHYPDDITILTCKIFKEKAC